MTFAFPLPRADQVGSLPRPAAVAAACNLRAEGSGSAEALREAEDAGIRAAVAMPGGLGLAVVTDGEMHRAFRHCDLIGMSDGFAMEERDPEQGVQFAGVTLRPLFPTITGRLGFPTDHPMLDHFPFLAADTRVTPKMSIPGPSCRHVRTAKADIRPAEDRDDPEAPFHDIARTDRDAVHAVHAAGCRSRQMDEIFFASPRDPRHGAAKQAEGWDPGLPIARSAPVMRAAIADRPEGMVIGMHLCRGSFRSTHAAEGACDRVADRVFNQTGAEVALTDHDSERAGGLEPPRSLARGHQRAMPGFIPTRTGTPEGLDDLRRRFDEAANDAGLDQMGIAPQCGFAATEEGKAVALDDRKRKLDLVVRTTEAVRGHA